MRSLLPKSFLPEGPRRDIVLLYVAFRKSPNQNCPLINTMPRFGFICARLAFNERPSLKLITQVAQDSHMFQLQTHYLSSKETSSSSQERWLQMLDVFENSGRPHTSKEANGTTSSQDCMEHQTLSSEGRPNVAEVSIITGQAQGLSNWMRTNG